MIWRCLKYFCVGPPEYGLNVAAADYFETGVRLLRTTDLAPDASAPPVFVDPSTVGPRHTLQEGDLLFSRSGTLGRSLLYSDDGRPTTYAGYLVRFRPAEGVSPRFLAYCAESTFFQGAIEADAITSTISNFNAERYAGIRIPWHEPSEQCRIVDLLDAETARIDALITKKRQMLELLRERRISATDRRVLQAEGAHRPVAALADYVNGWPFKPADFTPNGIPVVRIRQLVDPGAEQDLYSGTLPDRVRLRDGDVVFSWSGSLEVRLWERGDAWLNQHLFRVLPVPDVQKAWLLFALDTATRLFAQFMHGSAMTHITKPMMKLVSLPVPTQDVQRRIAAELQSLWTWHERTTTRLTRQVELLTERRQALITAAVSGQSPVSS